MTTRLKNATSTSTRTFDVIQKCLASHKAKQITFDYDNGRVVGIAFIIDIKGVSYPYRMPARIENVEKKLYPNRRLSDTQKEQAYRTAWANVRDWLLAQFAMIDTGMVEDEEVFLPYLITNEGNTLYEAMRDHQFLLPERVGD